MNLERLFCGRRRFELLGGPVAIREDIEAGGFGVDFEGNVVLTCTSREEALLGLTLVHSVFNRKFARPIRPLCMFVQRVVLGIDDGSKVPSAVTKFWHELAVSA